MKISGKTAAVLYGMAVGMSEENMIECMNGGEDAYKEAKKEILEKDLLGKNIIIND